MKNRPVRALVILVALPFLAGCYGVMEQSVPASLAERRSLDLRGVVITDTDEREEEVLRFREVHQLDWTSSSVSFVADVQREGRTETVTRLVPITELEGVLVRQLDAGKTSAIMGGVIVGTIAIISLIITGDSDEYLPG